MRLSAIQNCIDENPRTEFFHAFFDFVSRADYTSTNTLRKSAKASDSDPPQLLLNPSLGQLLLVDGLWLGEDGGHEGDLPADGAQLQVARRPAARKGWGPAVALGVVWRRRPRRYCRHLGVLPS